MSNTEYFKLCPIFSAGRLFSEGQGAESNPYSYGTYDHEVFRIEMERLHIEESRKEAQS